MTSTATSTPANSATFPPASTATANVGPLTPTPATPLQIRAQWPHLAEVGQAFVIEISIAADTKGAIVVTTQATGMATSVASPLPMGTTGPDVRAAFGDNYEAIAVAALSTTDFDYQIGDLESQSLEQVPIKWRWTLTPKTAGKRKHVLANIAVSWKEKTNGKVIAPREIWSDAFSIDVDQQLFTVGQVSILGLFSTVVGTWLGGPFVYSWWKDRRKQTASAEATTTKPVEIHVEQHLGSSSGKVVGIHLSLDSDKSKNPNDETNDSDKQIDKGPS